MKLVVDGETFEVTTDPALPGQYNCRWLTGPHDYGFSMARSDGSAIDEADLRAAISDFLVEINPATGYLD